MKKITVPSGLMGLAKGGMVMFVGTMLANAGSYLYHLLMGRMLGPVGYGELSALISLLYIFSVPTLVIQTVLVKYFSTVKANGRMGESLDLFLRSVKNLLLALLAGGTVVLILTPVISGFLHLTKTSYVLWLYAFFILTTLAMINGSFIQGFQKFVWYASFLVLGIFFKLIFSIPVAGFGVEAVLLASVAAAAVTYALVFIPVWPLFSEKRERFSVTRNEALRFALPTFLTLLGTTSLFSTDIILVKHYLPAGLAGAYAAMSILGKIIFYASSAVVAVLYPVVSERVAKNESPRKIIMLGITVTAIVSLFLTLVYGLFPGFITHMLFGTAYDMVIPYLFRFAVFISLYSLLSVMIMSYLAMNRTWIWTVSAGGAVMQVAGIALFHAGIGDIVLVNITVSAATLLVVLLSYLKVRTAVRKDA